MMPVVSLIRRDLVRAFRHPGDTLLPVLFFVVTVSLFPLGIGPDPGTLQSVAPGTIWIAALLATLLSLPSVFQSEFDDGTLDRILLSSHSHLAMAMGKVISHWLVSGLPLLLTAVILGYMLGMQGEAYPAMLFGLLIGTPTLSLIGIIGASLTLGARRGNLLITLIVMPLYVPVLIFGTGAINAATIGLGWAGHIYFLCAILALSAVLSPLAIVQGIKISLNQA